MMSETLENAVVKAVSAAAVASGGRVMVDAKKFSQALSAAGFEVKPLLDWKLVPDGGFSADNSGPFLLWREDWVDEDFNPTGVRDGWFQEGDPGEAYFGVADFNSCHNCYVDRQLHDPAEWPTHYAEKPAGPATT